MVTYMRRSDWTSHGPVRPLAPMPDHPLGFAVHWPGMTKGSAPTSQAAVAARLESYRVLHTSPGGIGTKDGGNDIAYQWCADLMGRLWPLRGFEHKSGANGDSTSNSQYGAVLLMLGPDDQVSDAMLQAVRTLRRDRWLPMYPHATRVIGHRDVYGTDCPGPRAYALVRSGAFTHNPTDPTRPEEIEVTKAELLAILDEREDELVGKLLGAKLGSSGPNVGVALQSGFHNTEQALDRLDRLEAAVEALKS